VAGQALCTGSIYRVAPGTGRPELVAWGFRNPVALAVDDGGQLYVGMHGADVRSTRPVAEDPDAVYRVRQGGWYGWPDFSADLQPITVPRYSPPVKFFGKGHEKLAFVIDHAASGLEAPDRSLLVAATEPHAALGGMTFVPPGSGPFARFAGRLLVSEMGDFKPLTDPVKPAERAGFHVEMIDVATGRRSIFARNRGEGSSQPASALDLEDGFERPVDVKVGPDGLIYVLDFGVFNVEGEPKAFPKTGKVFRIEPVRRR
jgi:glucose/arabinose dehydrogenase